MPTLLILRQIMSQTYSAGRAVASPKRPPACEKQICAKREIDAYHSQATEPSIKTETYICAHRQIGISVTLKVEALAGPPPQVRFGVCDWSQQRLTGDLHDPVFQDAIL